MSNKRLIVVLAVSLLSACERPTQRAKWNDLGTAFRLLQRVHDVSRPSTVVDPARVEQTRRQVQELIGKIDRPETLAMIARLSHAAAWPQLAEDGRTDLGFDVAYHASIEKLSATPGREAESALSSISLYVRPGAGELEILSQAIERQRALSR